MAPFFSGSESWRCSMLVAFPGASSETDLHLTVHYAEVGFMACLSRNNVLVRIPPACLVSGAHSRWRLVALLQSDEFPRVPCGEGVSIKSQRYFPPFSSHGSFWKISPRGLGRLLARKMGEWIRGATFRTCICSSHEYLIHSKDS